MISDQHGEPLHELWGDGLPRLGKIKLGQEGKLGNVLPTFRFLASEVSELRHLEMRAGEKAKGLKVYKDLKPRAEAAQAKLDEYIAEEYGSQPPAHVRVWLPDEDPLQIVTYQNESWGARGVQKCYCDGHKCHPLQKDGTRPEKDVPQDADGKFYCKGLHGGGDCKLSIIVKVHLPDMPGGTDGVFHVETKAINIFGAIHHELKSIRGHYKRLMGVDVKLYKRFQQTQYRDDKGQMRDSWQWIVHLAPWGRTLREATEDVGFEVETFRREVEVTLPVVAEDTADVEEELTRGGVAQEDGFAKYAGEVDEEGRSERNREPQVGEKPAVPDRDPEADLGDGDAVPAALGDDADAPKGDDKDWEM